MAGLSDIEGISPADAEKLKVQGLHTTEDLLKAGATPKSRGDLAAATGISESLILRWTNMADLFRIKGVAEQYSDLLEASGVDTVPELAQRNPENLLVKMSRVNEEKGLVHRVPTQEQVAAWVSEAKTLPRMISYGGAGGANHEDPSAPETKSLDSDEFIPQTGTAATPEAPNLQMNEGVVEWDTSGSDRGSAVPRVETAATSAAEQMPADEGLAGSHTTSSAWAGGVPQAKTTGTPSWTAREVHEWWGKRLWRSLRGRR